MIVTTKGICFLVGLSYFVILRAIAYQEREPRLAGGVPAKLGDFPYLAASLHPEIRCTASIIREDWLLGAAHCYVIDGVMVVPEDVVIVAGVVDFLDMLSPYRQNRLARHIYIHPKYEEEVLSSSDLAVVNVAPFQRTLFVNTIPVSGDPFALETEVRCMASGWGDHKENSNNTILRKLPVVAAQSETICHGLKPYQRFNMLCLKKNHGKGLCDGDSGGPLVCDDKVVGVAHQVYTEKSKWEAVPDMGCGARDIVHTYMFTCPYLNWIRLFIPEVPPKPPECFIPNRHSWIDSSQFTHSPPDPDNTLFGFPISPLN